MVVDNIKNLTALANSTSFKHIEKSLFAIDLLLLACIRGRKFRIFGSLACTTPLS